jgi:hypothetical protein
MLALLPRIPFNLHFISFCRKQTRAHIVTLDVMRRCEANSADDMKAQGLKCYIYGVNVLNLTNLLYERTMAYPGIFFRGRGVQQIQLRTEDRERGSGGGSPLVRGSGGSCSLVQGISFHIVNFS